MPADEVAKLRNVAVVGQGGAGKTTVADALLFTGGAATRFGRIDDATSAFDTEPEEQRRKTTITASLHHLAWRKQEKLRRGWREMPVPLFFDEGGGYLQPDEVRRRMKRVLTAAGLAPHYSPHGLRHTYASIALQEGKVSGDQVSFTTTGGNAKILFQGTVAGNEIKMTRTREGGQAREFTLKRAQ